MDSSVMKLSKLILLTTAALASLAIAITIQQQGIAPFNEKKQSAIMGHH
jgi:hypothetical protein